jgi:N-acetylmuramoyl-L-alanine amidase
MLIAPALCFVALSNGCGRSAGSLAAPTDSSASAVKPAASVVAASTLSPSRRSGAATSATSRRSPSVVVAVTRLPIVQSPIPFGARRKAEMVRYAMRHYGLDTYRLIEPHVIVVHYTETPDFRSTFNTFAPDVPDSELHELPNTCAHFVIAKDGTVHQLVPLGIMCRHTVGLNWTAIGIEHVGYSDAEVLADPEQMQASLHLVRWLRCRLHIPIVDVIGHNESLSSPYHHENVPALRTQTHSDFNRADMQHYRARLRTAGSC